MKAYDFDGTIYDGDSTVDFYLFAMRKHPKLLMTLPGNVLNAMRFKLGRISRQEFKQRYFQSFLPCVDADSLTRSFWRTHRERIKAWYLEQKASDDAIISASPEFLLRPICDELNVRLLASDVDIRSGAFGGPNLRGEEKAKAFAAAWPGVIPEAFYTDHKSDAPMMAFAERAFIVKGNRVRQCHAVVSRRCSPNR